MGGNKIDPIFISKEAAAVLTARAHDSLSVAESDYDGYCALNRRVERERETRKTGMRTMRMDGCMIIPRRPYPIILVVAIT